MTGDPLASCDMPVKACKNNLQCGSGSLCSDGVCVSKCTSSAGDCLPNEVCKNGVCKRICSNNEQCADNQVCIDRMCINGCLTSDQCPGSQVCSGNYTFLLFVGSQLVLKFMYSEKATKFCEISTLILSVCTVGKSNVEIS